MSNYKLIHKDGCESHRKTRRELQQLLKKREQKGEKGWRLVRKND